MSKASIPRAILLTLLFYIIFIVVELLVLLFLYWTGRLILSIPIIGPILSYEVVPDYALPFISMMAAYYISVELTTRFVKTEETASLMLKIIGIAMIIIETVLLTVNIIFGDAFFANIIHIILGIYMTVKSNSIYEA